VISLATNLSLILKTVKRIQYGCSISSVVLFHWNLIAIYSYQCSKVEMIIFTKNDTRF